MHSIAQCRIEDDRWSHVELKTLANNAFFAVFEYHNIDNMGWIVSILACSDTKITKLNTEFRENPRPTNILSWPSFSLSPQTIGEIPDWTEFENSLGDIAVAFETCKQEAKDKNILFEAHLTHLFVHGCLHLLGYDHKEEADALQMENLEIQLLEFLGVENPYTIRTPFVAC